MNPFEIATEAAELIGVVARLIREATQAEDPARLRRVRDVAQGELELERVLDAGEAAARRLQGER